MGAFACKKGDAKSALCRVIPSANAQEAMDRRRQLLAGADAALATARAAVLRRALGALHLHAVRSRMARMAVARWNDARVARWVGLAAAVHTDVLM
jgi:hypothetical protein